MTLSLRFTPALPLKVFDYGASMRNVNERLDRRMKLAMHAVVSDRQGKNLISCMIHDGSIYGCKIVTRQAPYLPEKILIKVNCLTRHIKGNIAWRNHNSAGIEFNWKTKQFAERRSTNRQKMNIPSSILDYSLNKLANCIICDISKSGCRITSEAISEIPDDILIDIPGLNKPVLSLVVWRNGNMAGLEFFCTSENYLLKNPQEQ
jgi:PilZ domain